MRTKRYLPVILFLLVSLACSSMGEITELVVDSDVPAMLEGSSNVVAGEEIAVQDSAENIPVEEAPAPQHGESATAAPLTVSSVINLDTGQVKCYDNSNEIPCPQKGEGFYGQDAQYASAQLAYVDNGDGTVTDLNTGLMWIQDPGEKMAYYDAIASAEDFSFADYNDWRVPTIKELYSLMDFSGVDDAVTGTDPFLNWDVFVFKYGDPSQGEREIDSQWVTSSIYTGSVMNGQECFFGVNFADGRIKCYPTSGNKNNGYFLRLVRGTETYGENQFMDNNNGTVSDLTTGLTWQQADSGEGMNWGDALAYCESLELAGQDDWRLPNAKELQYLVDYDRGPDETNSAAIDPLFSISSITNEAGQTDYPFFWSSTTHENARNAQNAAYISFGRAMGYMGSTWMDVHGAGAQRSDPKSGDPTDYPTGQGPQGDARRIDNYVRCVRGGIGDEIVTGGEVEEKAQTTPAQNPPSQDKQTGQESDLTTAAAQLGISEEMLRAALGAPPPDLDAAAAQLGITREALANALGLPQDAQQKP